MTRRTLARCGLGYLAAIALVLGVWAGAAPRSFYDSFPGLGMTWVAVDGPYNEHLVRDVGALNLALTVVLVAALVRLSGDLVRVAAAASLAWNAPHALYHTFNTDGLGTFDVVLNLGGLALSAVFPVVLLVIAGDLDDTTPSSSGEAER